MDQPLQTLANGRLTAAVSPLGAELRSLAVDGRERMWRADPAWWSASAPLLFPIVGALAGDAYRLGGQTYALPKHGFARRSLFSLMDAARDRATFRLEASAATRAVYPFDFRMDVTFHLVGDALHITADLGNQGAAPMPASFGFHPAFNWPLDPDGDRLAHQILFDHDEPAPIRRLTVDGVVAPDPLPTPVKGRRLALADRLFDHDALLFDRLTSRGLVYGAPGEAGLRIDFPEMPYLGVWTKPGAPYLCIEPWQGIADPEAYAGDFRDKPGVISVAPGEARRFAMSVRAVDRVASPQTP
jgi:galactose mutarotase-like enzyme